MELVTVKKTKWSVLGEGIHGNEMGQLKSQYRKATTKTPSRKGNENRPMPLWSTITSSKQAADNLGAGDHRSYTNLTLDSPLITDWREALYSL